MFNLAQDIKQNLNEKLEIHGKFLLEKLNMGNKIITIVTTVVAPIAISSITTIVLSLITEFLK
ncbi:conserved hypothetical protein (plasmid) [Borreliella valaisiana VS116]|uniref:Uncharacterized protein n=1 Tax=Borreliella valaisiana VS116 TaxID=445987 RepID=C0R974_BORVA|nr:conserved hypothetical protein [Borreliella valaisiana VS116]